MNHIVSLPMTNIYDVISEQGKLSDVPVGKTCRVRSLNATGLLRNRMLDIGIIPDTEIKVMRRNSAGDTTAFLIRETLIALRKEESSLVEIANMQ